jgi:hypothetical protein
MPAVPRGGPISNLAPNTSYVFFIGVRHDDFTSTGGTAVRLRCQLTVSVSNRNGTSSPL